MFRRMLRIESLEDRRLLAVSVGLNPNTGLLSISSDSAADIVTLEGRGFFGGVGVEVNGAPHGFVWGVNKINVNMGGGNDTVFISALLLGDSLNVNMGPGEDEVDIDNTTNPIGPEDNGPTLIGGNATFNLGGNFGDYVDAEFAADQGLEICGNLTLLGVADVDLDGEGGTFDFEASDISIAGNLMIRLTAFGDVDGDTFTVELDDVNLGGSMLIQGTTMDDHVHIIDSTFARGFRANLGAGDDILQLGFSRLTGRTTINGGSGDDTCDGLGGNVILIPMTLISVENMI